MTEPVRADGWKTSDGLFFDDYEKAKEHQANLLLDDELAKWLPGKFGDICTYGDLVEWLVGNLKDGLVKDHLLDKLGANDCYARCPAWKNSERYEWLRTSGLTVDVQEIRWDCDLDNYVDRKIKEAADAKEKD